MGRRFAVEWLWLLVSCTAVVLWILVAGSAESDVVFVSIILGPVLYVGIGIVRLTIWAIRTVWGSQRRT